MLGSSLIAAMLSIPVPTPAPQAPVRWEAPPGCPDRDRITSQIDVLLGRSLRADELDQQGAIEATSSGWTLTLTTRVGTLVDQRTLEAADCTVLADAAALVAVVMLDPVHAAARIEEEAAAARAARMNPQTRPEAPATPAPVPDDAPEAEPRRPRRIWVATRVRAGGEFGAVPGGTGTFDLGLALAGFGAAGRLRAEVVGLYSIGRDAGASEPVTIHLGAAAPRLCASLPAGPVDIPLCGGVEVGAMRADSDARVGGTKHALWLAAQAEPGLRWAFSDRLSLWVAAQIVVPIAYPDFELLDPVDGSRSESVYRPQPVSARGLLGLEVQLGSRVRSVRD